MAAPHYPPSRDGQSFLALEGDFSGFDTACLREQLAAAVRGEPHDLVVEMSGVWAISLEALAVLVRERARQKTLHRELTLIYPAGSATECALARAGLAGRFHTVREIA